MRFGTRSGSMRDRRNTNLSISSTASSASSHASPMVVEDVDESAEKGRFLWIPLREDAQPLPSPLLKHARETKQGYFTLCMAAPKWRNVAMLIALAFLFICYYFTPSIGSSTQLDTVFAQSDKQIDLINGAPLPQHPTPLIFMDKHSKPRWTVSIPPSFKFPLKNYEYRWICEASEGVSKSVEAMTGKSRIHAKGPDHLWKRPYNSADKSFMPVEEAEALGYLRSMPEGQQHISVVGETNETHKAPVCEKSLTYVMETDNAGFGDSLLALWLSYGLANKEGRSFFIDDSNWAYGNYSSYFPLPPKPACAAPPANQVVPCPHTARHLVVSAATIPWTFGPAFKAEYENSFKKGFRRNLRIFDLLRQGYEDLFALKGEDQAFMNHKLTVMRAAATASAQTPIVAMHIRRGDRHPFELEYSDDYLPFERYTSAASELFSSFHPNRSSSEPSALLLASDDPDIISTPDLLNTLPPHLTVSRPQERIVLASKKTLEPAVPIRKPGSAYVKHVDENSGWEGGFYASLFFALGKGHPAGYNHDMNDELQKAAFKLRELVGRAYILDLAILGHSDAVVCASSSAACRLVAVMMGRDKVLEGKWKNVDANRPWTWDGQV